MKLIVKLLGTAILVGTSAFASAALTPPALVVFGDSLSDSGNNTILLGGSKVQTISGNTYVPLYSYDPSGTYSNGDVWATQFASLMGFGPLLASSAAGTDVTHDNTNFAYGGAKTSGGQVPSLLQQTASFVALSGSTNYASTLFVVAGGGNNARDTLGGLAGQANPALAIGTAANQYAADTKNIVDQLQAKGAQHIVVWNVPNIGITPAARSAGASSAGAFVASSFNAALTTALQGENVQIFDVFSLTSLMSQTPAAFGLTNVADACGAPSNIAACPDISTAMFWDAIHPTTATHGIVAEQMKLLVTAVPEPSELAMLFVGLLVVAGAIRRRAA